MRTSAFILILTTAIVMSCNLLNESLETASCDFDTTISANLYANAPSDPVAISDIEISGDCLKITFSASGCDGNTWTVKLIDSEGIMESFPAQRNLRLSLENREICAAFLPRVSTFDISELQIPGDNSVYLNIVNSGDQILYEY